MNIILVAVGKQKRHSPLYDIYHSYCARLPWNITVKEIDIKHSSSSQLADKEGALLLKTIAQTAYVIVLDQTGPVISSEDFAAQLRRWQNQGNHALTFVIGGAYGHSKMILERANYILSLGKMTWPHMLVRTMLMEQLYRAYSILQHHPYHK